MHCPYLIVVTRKNGEAPLTTEEITDMLPDADDMFENVDQNVVDYIDGPGSWNVIVPEYFKEAIEEGLIEVRDNNTFAVKGDIETCKKHMHRLLESAKGEYDTLAGMMNNFSLMGYSMRNAMNEQNGQRVYTMFDADGAYFSDFSDYTLEEFLESGMTRKAGGKSEYYQLMAVYDYHC